MRVFDGAFAVLPDDARGAWTRALTRFGRHLNYGIRPYERDWDVLVVLDACRYDLFMRYAPCHEVYNRFSIVEPVYSCASSSDEWLEKSFEEADDEDLARTCYVTANAYTHTIDLDRFLDVEEVWTYARDPKSGTTFPDPVTNAAIKAYRERSPDRLVVHYLQPHAPFLHCLGKYTDPGDNQDVWRGVRRGEYDRDEVFEDYGRNLLAVLDHVETLVRNVSGAIVVTSDHANAIGEWGIYGHPSFVPVPGLKRVPWAIATGEGLREYELKSREEVTTVETQEPSIEEHLRTLGYLE